MKLTDLSDTQQNYLETIFLLSENDDEGAHLIDIAKALNVRPPSATEVIARLKDMNLLTQERRNKIKLTPTGAKLGEQVAARHKTIRTFLTDVLRVPKEIAETDACKIEHALGATAYNRLCDFLEHIDADKLEKDDSIPLTMMNRGEMGVISRIAGGVGKSRRLAAMGVRVGTEIKTLQNNHRAPVLIKAGESRVAIGRGLATCLHIKPLEEVDKTN